MSIRDIWHLQNGCIVGKRPKGGRGSFLIQKINDTFLQGFYGCKENLSILKFTPRIQNVEILFVFNRMIYSPVSCLNLIVVFIYLLPGPECCVHLFVALT